MYYHQFGNEFKAVYFLLTNLYDLMDSAYDCFGRLKDEFGGRMIRVRGTKKVMAHLMFGILFSK